MRFKLQTESALGTYDLLTVVYTDTEGNGASMRTRIIISEHEVDGSGKTTRYQISVEFGGNSFSHDM